MDIKGKFERLKAITLYPILFGIYPVLALLGQNINEVQPSVGLRPVIYVALASFCVLLVCKAIFKDWHRSAIGATMIIIFFFTYGHIYLALKTSVVNNFPSIFTQSNQGMVSGSATGTTIDQCLP
jgi:hypothetical protein